MADKTLIEWTDATWNPITGCSVVDAGCTNCYAMQLAGTRLKHHPSRAGLTRVSASRPKWTGEVRLNADWLDQPLRWKRPRRIFVCAHGDLFHSSVPDGWIDQVFATMAAAPHHIFQVLTKRPERAYAYLTQGWASRVQALLAPRYPALQVLEPLHNVWLGTSISDQESADARIPKLLGTPAALRFISAEPLLGRVTLIDRDPIKLVTGVDAQPQHRFYVSLLKGWGAPGYALPGIDWVIVGGESGPNARPMHPDWVRTLRDECADAGVPFFFKQWGAWGPAEWKVERQPDEAIEDFKVRAEAEGATHAIAPWGHLHEPDHRPWSIERTRCEPHDGIRRWGKGESGRLLDAQEHSAFPGGEPCR